VAARVGAGREVLRTGRANDRPFKADSADADRPADCVSNRAGKICRLVALQIANALAGWSECVAAKIRRDCVTARRQIGERIITALVRGRCSELSAAQRNIDTCNPAPARCDMAADCMC